MQHYRNYLLNAESSSAAVKESRCADDSDALARAADVIGA